MKPRNAPRKLKTTNLAAIKRTLPCIPTDLFSFKNRRFVAEASDLKAYTFNSYITLVNPKTGGEKAFDLVSVNRDADQDVRYWLFRSDDGLEIQIFND